MFSDRPGRGVLVGFLCHLGRLVDPAVRLAGSVDAEDWTSGPAEI